MAICAPRTPRSALSVSQGGELEEHREALLGQLRKVRTAVQRYRLGAKSAEAALESVGFGCASLVAFPPLRGAVS